MTQYYWLSFADDTGNLGCTIVRPDPEDLEAAKAVRLKYSGRLFVSTRDRDFGAADFKTTRLGFNPGGEVLGGTIEDRLLLGPEWRDRLLTPAEAREACAAMDKRAGL